MNSDDFEKHLQRQPLRQVPQDWRAEILRSAAASSPSTPDPLLRRSTAKTDRPSFLSTIFWPNPKAWAGLAAVWVAIFVLRFTSRDNVPHMAKTSSPRAQQIVMNLKEQQQILAELIGATAGPSEMDRPKRFVPQPHSELHCGTSMA